ncbi:hypothetical protein GXW82_36180 [Streptacidiphilus sp. 4-A2]|nr:hypothetical protein [Streptacidiphilus sp. 4-A2]
MTANVLEHRRAKAFADAVEDRPDTAAAQQFPELLTMVDALGSLPEPVLAPEVQSVQRALLVAEFERAFAGGGGSRHSVNAAATGPRRSPAVSGPAPAGAGNSRSAVWQREWW